MNSEDFSKYRKKLKKTQKELAKLLGTSLKAVSAYEQGWRVVPPHVERQVFFLLSRKTDAISLLKDCWKTKDCPKYKRENCPAWEFKSGKLCWFINGTICEAATQRSWEEKIKICKKCKVMQDILK